MLLFENKVQISKKCSELLVYSNKSHAKFFASQDDFAWSFSINISCHVEIEIKGFLLPLNLVLNLIVMF